MENVRPQWALLGAVFNLKKMYKHWAAGKLALKKGSLRGAAGDLAGTCNS